MQEGDTAVIASTPDGNGSIVIDNFLTINGQNACVGVAGQKFKESCFGRQGPLVIGQPIETVLTPIPPINVSALIPVGINPVDFELRDFGVIAGNTDLFLVTTASANLSTRLTPSPSALKQAFDEAIGVCRDSMTTSARAIFNEAFTQQIAQPILKSLKSARTKPQIIDQIRDQLNAARRDLSDEINDGIEESLKQISLNLPTVPRSSQTVRHMTGAPLAVRGLNPNIPSPQISTDQSISEILAEGFDPTRLTVAWSDITATCDFGEDASPQTAFGTINPTLGLTIKNCPGPNCETDFSIAAKVQSFTNTTTTTNTDPTTTTTTTTTPSPNTTPPTTSTTTTTTDNKSTKKKTSKLTITITWESSEEEESEDTPDLSRIGVILLIVSMVFLALWRKQPGALPPV